MNYDQLKLDLPRCFDMMTGSWCGFDLEQDKITKFVYYCHTLDECLAKIKKFNADENYALHKWYNFMTSEVVKDVFCRFGAVAEEDKYNKNAHFYINNVPFVVKLVSYPNSLIKDRPYDLKSRSGRNDMIKWFYSNRQSTDDKPINCIFVMFDGKDKRESLGMKSDFALIENKVELFMNYVKTHDVNEITLDNENKEIKLHSELLLIIK